MSSFYRELSSQIIESDGFNIACDKLFKAYISKITNEVYEVDDALVKNLATSIQYFYRSGLPQHLEEGAVLLSMLLNVAGEKKNELIAIADNVFYHSGDFPNITLLEEKYPKIDFKISIFDDALKNLKKDFNTVAEIDHPLTDYQRSLWEDLILDNDVITSAPTSTGKTHIILRYLVHKLMKSEAAFAAVVVPTRALISELAGETHRIVKQQGGENEIEICTVPKEGKFKDKTFFVMTQERLFDVLQSNVLNFNYLFVDEAHNISDESRGVLLHLTLQKVLESSYPQIIISMPSPRYQNAFNSVFEGVRFTKRLAKHSPVAKIMMSVKLKGNNIQISRFNKNNVVTIDKKFTGDNLANIVDRLGHGESNIIYQNQPHHCETYADKISKLLPDDMNNIALEEAADYVENFLHERFTLASNLRKGVAFHYGPLPAIVRNMIENLVREKCINFIVCTSTLAEGVNLPAKNLFLKNPQQQVAIGKPWKRLEDVKLNNITGRAGRMLEHFAGNIFLIDHDNWKHQDYFDECDEEVDKVATYFKKLNEDFKDVIRALKGEYEHYEEGQYTYYTIANKLLKELDGGNLSKTLSAKELTLNDNQRHQLEAHIQQALNTLKVDTFTLEANPTVGFIQQNKLYSFLTEENDLSEWTLLHPKSNMSYDRLVKVCHLLSDVGIFIPREAYSIEHACSIAIKWMKGDTLKSIIIRQITADKEYVDRENEEIKNTEKKKKNYKSCNYSVRKVIKVVDTDVRFRLSNALRCYHSLITDIIGSKKIDLLSAKLHSIIEVGCCKERVIGLIGFGLSRETALEIDRILPKVIAIKSIGDLRKLHAENKLGVLHAVTNREIKALLQ